MSDSISLAEICISASSKAWEGEGEILATGIGLILVSHLRRPEGNKGYEDGIQTSLNSLRGSHAISQLSDSVIALERKLNL